MGKGADGKPIYKSVTAATKKEAEYEALQLHHKAITRELEDDTVKLPQKQKYQPKVLDTEQVATLLRAIRGNVMELPILLVLWCCLRESEICGLKWTDIDWERGRLHIHEARVLTGTTQPPLRIAPEVFLFQSVKKTPRSPERSSG